MDSATVWEVETEREDKNSLFPILLDQESPFKNVIQNHMYLDHNLDQNFMRRQFLPASQLSFLSWTCNIFSILTSELGNLLIFLLIL